MQDLLNLFATEIYIRAKILGAKHMCDAETSEILASYAKLIREELDTNSPDYAEITKLGMEINTILHEILNSDGRN